MFARLSWRIGVPPILPIDQPVNAALFADRSAIEFK
jgi:hypothetical protein